MLSSFVEVVEDPATATVAADAHTRAPHPTVPRLPQAGPGQLRICRAARSGGHAASARLVGHRIRIDVRSIGVSGTTLANLSLTAGPDVRVLEGNLVPHPGYWLIPESAVVTCSAASIGMSATGTVTLSLMLARHAELITVGGTPTVRLTGTPSPRRPGLLTARGVRRPSSISQRPRPVEAPGQA